MDGCAADSLRIIGCSFLGFTALNYVSSRCAAAVTTFYNDLDERKKSIWDNTFVSYIHAWICSIITPLCFYYYPDAWNDLIHTDVSLFKAQISLSIGYFFADMFDFYMKNIFMDSPGIWFHHIVVCSTFISSIVTCKYSPYLSANLLVEISNIFLHQRKLYITSYRTKSTSFFYYNSLFLFLSFIFSRMIIQGYLLVRVWNEYSIFGHKSHWRVAFLGMVAMNVLNLQLFSQLWSADWSKMRAGSKSDVGENNGPSKKGKKWSNERKKK